MLPRGRGQHIRFARIVTLESFKLVSRINMCVVSSVVFFLFVGLMDFVWGGGGSCNTSWCSEAISWISLYGDFDYGFDPMG